MPCDNLKCGSYGGARVHESGPLPDRTLNRLIPTGPAGTKAFYNHAGKLFSL